MALLTRILPSFSSVSRQILPTAASKVSCVASTSCSEVAPGGLFGMVTRNIIRIHFPRPNEVKRIKRHGYKTRMSTPEGRRVLMNRILKGRFVISH